MARGEVTVTCFAFPQIWSANALSQAHLDALEKALDLKGWRIVTVHPGNNRDIAATWEIHRGGEVLYVDFDGMNPDGDLIPVTESCGCFVRGIAKTDLYFRKVNRSRQLWQKKLAEFVQALDTAVSANPRKRSAHKGDQKSDNPNKN